MFEELKELAVAGGIDRFVISLNASSADAISVSVQSILGAAPSAPTPEQAKIREALSQPLMVSGTAGEVDARMDSLLTEYVTSIRPTASLYKTNLPDVDKAVAAAEAATAVKPEKKAAAKKTTKTESEPAAPSDELTGLDKFTSGDADSL